MKISAKLPREFTFTVHHHEPVLQDLQPGDVLPDGTIFVGVVKDWREGAYYPIYAAPMNGSLCMNFNEATRYAKSLNIGGKNDFRVPNRSELEALLLVRKKGAFPGTFKTEPYLPDTPEWSDDRIVKRYVSTYWTSDVSAIIGRNAYQSFAHAINADGGTCPYYDQSMKMAVRCVRRGPKIKSEYND